MFENALCVAVAEQDGLDAIDNRNVVSIDNKIIDGGARVQRSREFVSRVDPGAFIKDRVSWGNF